MSILKPMVTANFADHIIEVLTPLLGPHTAKRALAMICKRADKELPELGHADLPLVCATLRPMLRTLIGNDVTVRVLADIADHAAHADHASPVDHAAHGDLEDPGLRRSGVGRGPLEGSK